MNTIQKIRVAKIKRNCEGQYKTLYKLFDEYGTFLYYQAGADGEITEFLDDFYDMGYLLYDYKFNPMKKERVQ